MPAETVTPSPPPSSVHAEEMPGLVPAVVPESGSKHGPGADLFRIEWAGRRWLSRPRIVWATDDERRCINTDCRRVYPCSAFRRSSWPY